MRILLISRCPPYPLYLGDRLIVYHLAHELELRHHEIDLLAYANRPEDWHEQDEYDMYFGEVQLFHEPKRSQLDYLKRVLLPSARWPRKAEESWSPELWRAVQAKLQSRHYDAVHLFGGIQVYEFFKALGDVPALITPYESFSLYMRRVVENQSGLGLSMAWIRWQLARSFERWMFTSYRQIVVVSDRDRNELLNLNPKMPVTVIPNGVDTYEFRPRPVKRVPALLFVGNYEYAPNVDAALRLARDIFPEVQKRIPEVKLWLVGNVPPPELLGLQGDDKRQSAIKVTGRVPDVRPYLARAGAFVSPLKLGAGIKNKVLEALAMGCPVIGTPLSMDGIAITPGHDGLIADTEHMADAVIKVLQDADLSQQLSTNGRKLIEARYSWDAVAEQYEQLYKAISA